MSGYLGLSLWQWGTQPGDELLGSAGRPFLNPGAFNACVVPVGLGAGRNKTLLCERSLPIKMLLF